MRYRLMASYLGASYQAAVGPSDRDVTLFAAPPPPEEHGFSPAPGGVWRRQVRLNDIDALWESRPIGSYHGEPCLVLDDLGDRLHIVYLGMDERRAGQLGYWQVDRGVFEVVVPRMEVSDLAEERHEFPIALLLSALPRALNAPEAPPLPGPQQMNAWPAQGPNGPNGPNGLSAPYQAAGTAQYPGPSQPPPMAQQPPMAQPAPMAQPPPMAQPAPTTQPPTAAAWHGSPVADGGGTWHYQPDAGPGQVAGNGAYGGAQYAPQQGPQQPAQAAYPPAPAAPEAPVYAAPEAPAYVQPTAPVQLPTPTLPPPAPLPPPSPPSLPPLPPPPPPSPAAPSVAVPPEEPPRTLPGQGTPASPEASPAAPPGGPLSKLTGAVRGRRAARKPRLSMSAVFADLVDMADIPRSAYAVDEEVTGAMCLFKTDGGYEVFSCAEDARHEVRFFDDEEAAYFYLFGVLAAEALRNGRLNPRRG